MINTEDKQKIKDNVQQCFIERNESTIQEKISYCIDHGMPKDEAQHTVIQIVQNLPKYLLPLNSAVTTKGQDAECADGKYIPTNENIQDAVRIVLSLNR